MRRLKGSPGILVFLFYFGCLWSQTDCGPRVRPGRCPHKCDCDEITLTLNCSSAGLNILPLLFNPRLRKLCVNNNEITAITNLYNVYSDLTYCDLSYNLISDLGTKVFRSKSQLRTLLITHNLISSVSNHTFFGLDKLQTLHLDENRLGELPTRAFHLLPSLEMLDLSKNSIEYIADNAFQGMRKLKTLRLENNKLRTVPSASLQYVSSLMKLDLGANPFERQIPNDSFRMLPNLSELSIGGCNVSNLNARVFYGLSFLRKLRLDGNKLKDVPTNALQLTMRLEELDLSQNGFRSISARAFHKLQYLKKIVISKCAELEVISRHTFMDNVLLEHVILEQNPKLHRIELGAFDGLANLKRVSFRGSGFQTLDSRLLSWDELEFLDLSENPIKCECRLSWLRNLLRMTNISKDVMCVLPQHLAGRQLVNLTDEELQCDYIASRRQLVMALAASAVVLVALLATLGFRYRTTIAGVLKDRWGGNRKEPQYQKTNSEEESTILHAAQQSLKMTPVTEL